MYNINSQMSRKMYRTLEYIAERDVRVEHVAMFHQGTFFALVAKSRGYVRKVGDRLELTKEGHKVLGEWRTGSANLRSEAGQDLPISERVEHVLALGAMRGLRVMKKAS